MKHLKAGQLGEAIRLTAADRLYNYAIACYENKTASHKRNLLQALRFKPTAGLALRYIFAMCCVDSERFARLRRILQRRSSGEVIASKPDHAISHLK